MSDSSALSRQRRWLASAALLLCVGGAGFAGYLTRIKFRQLALPCLEPGAGCRLSEQLDCSPALDSWVSMWLWLPLSLWGTAFYAAQVVIVGAIWLRSGAIGGVAPHLVLASASFSALLSVVLGGYSGLVLGAYCPYCLRLYAISALFLGVAIALYRQQRREGAERWGLAWRRPGALLDSIFWTSMVIVCVAGLQSVGFQIWRRNVDPQTGCPEVQRSLPPTDLVLGAEAPELILALFVDPTCHHCKQEYERVVSLHNERALGPGLQVQVFLFPRHACDSTSFPGGFAEASSEARENSACLAALATECAEQLKRGAGLVLLGKLYGHHDVPDGQPLFTKDKIAATASELGLSFDPKAPDNPLLKCIDGDEAAAQVAVHQKYLLEAVFHEPTTSRQVPVLMLIPVQAGVPSVTDAQFLPAGASKRRIVRHIEELTATYHRGVGAADADL